MGDPAPTIDRILAIWREARELKERFFEESAAKIAALADIARASLRDGNKILLFGNGGSAADAQHIAAELVGRFRVERNPLPALALTTDTSALTAISNDFGFEEVFARQIQALGRPGDLVIAISTSGDSENVVRGVAAAKELSLRCAGLLGGEGGRLVSMVDPALLVPHSFSARVQEVHIMVGHILCELVEEKP